MKNCFFLLLCCLLSTSAMAQPTPTDFENLKFRFIGPEGNRAIAIAGVPGDPMINYIGAASGGLWKTKDGGITWNPIFDDQDVSSIGSIAIAPSDPNTVWVGTGETFVIRPAHAMGDGAYKSTDAGKSWVNMGLTKTGRIGQIVIHPDNADIVYVAALGHTYGHQDERGVYKTIDGGKTWKKVLFVDAGTGAADIAMDPQNPERLLVGMWSVNINTWGLNSGGPGGGIYRSLDGGKNWQALKENGLPGGAEHPVGKTGVAIAHSDPNVVYALFEIESPAFYRSENFGDTWELMTRNHTINERAPYYTRMRVSTGDPDEVYFANVKFSTSKDGGKTIKSGYKAGGDNHDIWIDPLDPDRIMVAHDGCASISLNHGETFQRIVLPIAQMYHVSVDDQIPYNVYGNRQDGYSYKGPSNSLQGYIPLGLWKGVGGCESGFAQPDPLDNNIVWSGCYDGGLERYNALTGHARDVRVWPEAAYGWAPEEVKYRWHWNFPLCFSPHVRHRVYVGSQYVHQSDDGGQSWKIISPDLTLNDKTHQKSSGGVAVDNLMTFDGSVLFAVQESTLEPGIIWTGSNDGQVQLTRNYGKDWTNVTGNIPDLPSWGTIANIEISRHKRGTAYIAVDLHQMGDFDAYVYKTEDYGCSWKKISEGVPKSVHSFAHVIKEDPKREGLLYLGVDNGLYISWDDGDHWMRLKNNLPPAPVYWLTIQERFDDLVIGTYGRGYYILDDIGAIRNFPLTENEQEHFFAMRPAFRFQSIEAIKTDGPSLNAGRNPSYGALINYYLRDSVRPGEIEIEILDQNENIVRTLKAQHKKGINRVSWDLRYEPTYKPRLQVPPPGRPWVQLNGEGWRPLVTWDLDLMRGQLGPKVVPGKYTVRLKVEEKVYTQSVEVLKDPKSEGSLEDITTQVAFSLELRDAINHAVSMINTVEELRSEVERIKPELNEDDKSTAQRLLKIAESVAGALYDIHLTGAREDAFRSPMKLYGRLSSLASDITGNGVDFRPTDQQEEVKQIFDRRLGDVNDRFDDLIKEDLKALNEQLKTSGKKIEIKQKTGRA